MEVSASNQPEHRQSLLWSMNLSLVIGVLMLVMKVGAYWLTGYGLMRESVSGLLDECR